MMVFVPGICTHLLDIGVMHEPFCHVTTGPILSTLETHKLSLTPILTENGKDYVVNLATLDLIDMTVSISLITQTFKSDTAIENKLAILHYLILHQSDIESASEVCSINL